MYNNDDPSCIDSSITKSELYIGRVENKININMRDKRSEKNKLDSSNLK